MDISLLGIDIGRLRDRMAGLLTNKEFTSGRFGDDDMASNACDTNCLAGEEVKITSSAILRCENGTPRTAHFV